MLNFNAIPQNPFNSEADRLDYMGQQKFATLLKKHGGKIDVHCHFRFPGYHRVEVSMTVLWKKHRKTLADLCRSVTPWIYCVEVKGS